MLVTLLLLLQLRHGICNVHGSTVHANSSDMLSLLDFKKSITSDPKGALSSWNTTTHFCLWNGVTCSSKHPWRVMKLDLGSYGLSGSLSPSLGNLTLIEELRPCLDTKYFWSFEGIPQF
ncbi:unnamed protein product [Urochloa decumbens]|uniref:Leucine-rich repeat-containing N-terminal plant-type domain-containing protein n=1 Tax=Urochloa decumbens TaxID=240449 RepID=A0ABC9DT14_9POAL